MQQNASDNNEDGDAEESEKPKPNATQQFY
jgi:hypothetical protein